MIILKEIFDEWTKDIIIKLSVIIELEEEIDKEQVPLNETETDLHVDLKMIEDGNNECINETGNDLIVTRNVQIKPEE